MTKTPLAVCIALLAISAIAAAGSSDSVVVSADGRARIVIDDQTVATLSPMVATPGWRITGPRPADGDQPGDARHFGMTSDNIPIAGRLRAASGDDDGSVAVRWTFIPEQDVQVATLAVSAEFRIAQLAGGTWDTGDRQGVFPEHMDRPQPFIGTTRSLVIRAASRSLRFTFPRPTYVVIQDNRHWRGSTYSIRIGVPGTTLAGKKEIEVDMTIQTDDGDLSPQVDAPVIITADEQWIPLNTELDIIPGSALDLSHLTFTDAPAGKHGWITARGRHFVFENQPDKPRRFYGINLCFSANYMTHKQADQLLDRLVRLGYNTIRLHHHESELTGGNPGFDWNPERLDQLDYLLAGCRKRGIYVTTDLYVSRPVSAEQVQMPDPQDWTYRFKVLIPVHEPAFADWERFTRAFLDRVNPYTGVRWAEDPTLAWLALINEGNVGNYWDDVRKIPQWTGAWNRWLAGRYPDRAALAAAWGDDLKPAENPADGSVALPSVPAGDTQRHRDCTVFIAETELAMYQRMEKVIRDLGSRALLTNLNSWTNPTANQLVRREMDYVDDHFYIDHPEFLEQSWRLPSRSGNDNPLRHGAPGGRANNFHGLIDRPFTISEYNYSAPGRFRGVGGILTGAMGGLQDWGAIWRFAYAHNRDSLFAPAAMGYFNLAADPLNQAADRAAVMLFLRGDLSQADGQVAMVFIDDDLRHPAGRVVGPTNGPSWAGWVTKIGSIVVDDPSQAPDDAISLFTGWSDASQPVDGGLTAFNTDTARLMAELRSRGIIDADNPTDPARNIFQSQTGQVLIDGSRALLRFDTDRTGGGYAEPGESIDCERAGVRVSDLSIGATVFVTAVDGQPIGTSRRLLITHLTDLQNTGASYADSARQTLTNWGKLPHLVRHGTATVTVRVDQPEQWTVWSLTTSGRRIAEHPLEVAGDAIVIRCDIAGPDGARMLYELSRR